MNVKNHSSQDEEVEKSMAIIVGIDIKTLQLLRKHNLIPREYYRCVNRGKVGINDKYIYKREEIIKLVEELRDEGIIKRRRKKV